MSSPGVFILQTEYGDEPDGKTARVAASAAEPQPAASALHEEGAALANLAPVPTNFASLVTPLAAKPLSPAPALPTRLSRLSVARDTPLPLTLTPFARALLRR